MSLGATTGAALRKLRTARRVLRDRGVPGIAAVAGGHLAFAAQSAGALARSMPALVAAAASGPAPRALLAFDGGIGDDLLLTAVARELRRRGAAPLWIASRHAALYDGNADVDRVVPWTRARAGVAERLGWPVVYPAYATFDMLGDRASPPARHIISLMCQQAGVVGRVALRPYLHLTDAERTRGRIVPRQVAIVSSGLSARFPMRTKEWFPDRFQQVVARLGDRVGFVQLGAASDPPLDGARDLRGRTSLRETAAILSQSLAFVGQIGLAMHLARAVDCRSVIVYGGRELPSQSGYVCNENVHVPMPCSPCWRINGCDHAMRCMDAIDADHVASALLRQLARAETPLEVEEDEIPADGALVREPGWRGTHLSVRDPWGVERTVPAWFEAGRHLTGAPSSNRGRPVA